MYPRAETALNREYSSSLVLIICTKTGKIWCPHSAQRRQHDLQARVFLCSLVQEGIPLGVAALCEIVCTLHAFIRSGISVADDSGQAF